MKREEASYTVELSLMMPVVVFVLFAPVYAGLRLYEQTAEISACGLDQEFCAEEGVRNIKWAKEMRKERE